MAVAKTYIFVESSAPDAIDEAMQQSDAFSALLTDAEVRQLQASGD